MVDKLELPFPLLSDPDRSKAIEPMGVSDPEDRRNIAKPSIVVVAPDGEVAFAETSRDYADRDSEDAAIAALVDLGLAPTSPEEVELGSIEPGPGAMPKRHADIAEDAEAFIAQMDRYIELVRHLRGKS